jgi:hypothetical protein
MGQMEDTGECSSKLSDNGRSSAASIPAARSGHAQHIESRFLEQSLKYK